MKTCLYVKSNYIFKNNRQNEKKAYFQGFFKNIFDSNNLILKPSERFEKG